MPGKNIIAVKSTEGRLGFYDLDSLCLLKRITITRIGAQDEGFCFSPDGSFFYNIEKPITSLRTQLGVYETNTFTKVSTLFAEDVRTVLRHLEFDEKTGTCYLLGYVRNDMGCVIVTSLRFLIQRARPFKTSISSAKSNMIIWQYTNIGN